MNPVAAAFWGAFFGASVLMLAAALAAWAGSMRRVTLMVALSCVLSATYAAAYIGWLPIENAEIRGRILGLMGVVWASLLGLMLLALLGLNRPGSQRRRIFGYTAGAAVVAALAGAVLDAGQALEFGSSYAVGWGLVGAAFCVAGVLRRDSLAWLALCGVGSMMLALVGLREIALAPGEAPVALHAATAMASTTYLASMAVALWQRYSYLLELSEALAHGPDYDPVTRMLSHRALSRMANAQFFRHAGETAPVGVIVVSIANLYALEKLHGRPSANHALFLCASRLKRVSPAGTAMCRIGDDGFLLLHRRLEDGRPLIALARQIVLRLTRPVNLSASADPSELDSPRTNWVADIGVGLLMAEAPMGPAAAIAQARAMSRTAWSYASRAAWYDQIAGQITELPLRERRGDIREDVITTQSELGLH